MKHPNEFFKEHSAFLRKVENAIIEELNKLGITTLYLLEDREGRHYGDNGFDYTDAVVHSDGLVWAIVMFDTIDEAIVTDITVEGNHLCIKAYSEIVSAPCEYDALKTVI